MHLSTAFLFTTLYFQERGVLTGLWYVRVYIYCNTLAAAIFSKLTHYLLVNVGDSPKASLRKEEATDKGEIKAD